MYVNKFVSQRFKNAKKEKNPNKEKKESSNYLTVKKGAFLTCSAISEPDPEKNFEEERKVVRLDL